MYLNRCILEQFQLVRCLFQSYSQRISLGVFEISLSLFCFLLIINIHVSQYEESAFKQFCNPVLDHLHTRVNLFRLHLEERMDQTSCFRINTANCLYRG